VLVVECVDLSVLLHQVIDMLNTRKPSKLVSYKHDAARAGCKTGWSGLSFDKFVVGYGITIAQRNHAYRLSATDSLHLAAHVLCVYANAG
jgi:hypoxanthine phosphoribosyltransferase